MEDVSICSSYVNVFLPMFFMYSFYVFEIIDITMNACVPISLLPRVNATCVIKYPSGNGASKSAKLIYNQATGMIYILNISTQTDRYYPKYTRNHRCRRAER